MSTSDEHEKALSDVTRQTGDSTSDRLERLKRIEELRLKGYQKVKSLTEGKSGTSTSPTRRSYSSFSPETSPSFYGSLGRINYVGGVKPKSYSSQTVLNPTESSTNYQKTKSSSLSDDEGQGDDRPKHLLRSRSATTVSDTGLSTFQFGSEQNISHNPMGSEEEHWRERNDSYNEEDENIEDFKRSLFGDISSFANKTSPQTDGTLKAFSLSREWSSGGAEYEDPSEEQGNHTESREDNGENFNMFPSYNSEFLGMSYGETFEGPQIHGTTIRKSFSREKSRQPLLRSFSSQRETVPESSYSLGYSTGSDRNTSRRDSTGNVGNTSRLDSELDRIFSPSSNIDKISSHAYERQTRLDSALDSIFSRDTQENISFSSDRRVYEPEVSTRTRVNNRYIPGADPSYTSYSHRGLSSGDRTARNSSQPSLSSERRQIGLSKEAESKLDELFGPSTDTLLSNKPSFTPMSSRWSETLATKSRPERITINRVKSNINDGRNMSANSTFDHTRDHLNSVPDVLSSRMFNEQNDDNMQSEILEDSGMRENPVQSSLDEKLDSLFKIPDVLSTTMMDNENYEVTQSKRPVLNRVKPTLSSMLYGTEDNNMESGEITQTEGQPRQNNVRRTVTETWNRRRQNSYQERRVSQQSDINGEDSVDGSELIQGHWSNDAETMDGSTEIKNVISLGDVDVDKNDDMVNVEVNEVNMDNTEYLNQSHVSEIETDTHEEICSDEKLMEKDEISTEENGFHGNSVVTNQEVINRLKTDLLQGSETVNNSQDQQQSAETIITKPETDVERDEIQVTKEQQNQKSTKGRQADSKKNKKKSKGKKSKGKKGQKENVEKVAEKEITKKDSSECVLETDIDAALCQGDQQNIDITDTVVVETSSLHVKTSEQENSSSAESIRMEKGEERENNSLKENEAKINIQAEKMDEEGNIQAEKINGEGNIQAENEEEEDFVEAERFIEVENEGVQDYSQTIEDISKDDTSIGEENTKSETENSELNPHTPQTDKSPTKNTSWIRSKFNSLIHGFGTDSNANETETEVQQKVDNLETVSKLEGVSAVNGDLNMNVVATSDAGTVSEDDYATASDDDITITQIGDEFYETNYSQSVQDSNIKNDQMSAEMSSEGDAVDIFSELAATTGMPLDRGERFQDSVDVDGHIMYEREEELLRCGKEESPKQIVKCTDDKQEIVVKQQEVCLQSEGRVYLHDGVNKMEEKDIKHEENGTVSQQLDMDQVNKMVAKKDASFQLDVKQSVCTTEISIQTDVEAYLTADKVSISVQTLPRRVDKWTQTDTELAVDSKEFGIQVSPSTADYSAQYSVCVKESGTQVINKGETELVKDQQLQSDRIQLKNENELDHVKRESSHQIQTEQFSSEQVQSVQLSSEQVQSVQLSSEQVQSVQISSEQVKLAHPSLEQTDSQQLSSKKVKLEPLSSELVKLDHPLTELVKSEQLSSEQVKRGIAVGVNPELIVTDKITPEYAVAEQIKIEHVEPGQVKLGVGQTSGTPISVTEEGKDDTKSLNLPQEDLSDNVDHSGDVKVILSSDVTKVNKSDEGQVTVTPSETINTWSHNIAAPTEMSFSSQSLGKKVPPQPLPKRRSKHGSSKPASRPSSIVADGDGFDFHASEQSTGKLESSSFNFNKILSKTEVTNKEMPSDKGKGLDNANTGGTAKSEALGPLSPGAKDTGRIPAGSSGTLLTMVVGPKSPRAQEHGMNVTENLSTTVPSKTSVTSPRSSLSGMASLGNHSNKGNIKSPPPALLPKRKATTQLQMPTSPKSPTSPRSSEKLEIMQEYDAVFAKQMKMNDGEQKIAKEPINRLKDNPFIRKDGNVKMGRQESFSKKCEILTRSKPRTLSSSLTPKSPKDEPKDTGDIPSPIKEPAADLNVLDSTSLRSEIIRQSTSRSSVRNVAKSTKNVDKIRSKMETSSDSSGKKVTESSSIVNKIISNAAKFEAKFSSGSSGSGKGDVFNETSSVLRHGPLERDNPFIMPSEDESTTVSQKLALESPPIGEISTYIETSFNVEEVQTQVIQKESGRDEPNVSSTNQTFNSGAEAKVSTTNQTVKTEGDANVSTIIQNDEKQIQGLENKIEPPQRKRKLKVQVPPQIKPGEEPESKDYLDGPSLASLVSSQLQEIGVGEIAGLAVNQNSSSTNREKVIVKMDQQNAAKPPSPITGKPPSPKTGKPPSPKIGKPPSPKTGKPPSPTASKSPPPRHNRPLSPKVGKTPPSPRKSPSPNLTTTISSRSKQKSPSGSTPPSPGGSKPLSPRVRQSPLSKAMFGDKENGKPGSDLSGELRSRRRSSEKTGSISSRTSSVSSEGSSTNEKGKSARLESSKSRQKGSKETPSVPDNPEESLKGQKGTKKAPPVPEKPKRMSSLKKDKHSLLKDTESSASKSKGKGGFSFLKGKKSSK